MKKPKMLLYNNGKTLGMGNIKYKLGEEGRQLIRKYSSSEIPENEKKYYRVIWIKKVKKR